LCGTGGPTFIRSGRPPRCRGGARSMTATGKASVLPGTDPKGRVLLADDEEPLVRAISRALVKSGYQVTTAPDGVEATRRLDEAAFDLVMSDIAMPGMGGIE